MAVSLAQYAETSLIQTIQDLYTSELNLPSNLFDSDGRINIVQPSNLTPMCADIIRGLPQGMIACKESDRQGALLLREALASSRLPELSSESGIEPVGLIEATFHSQDNSRPVIGVAYLCRAGILDFAVPISDPDRPIDTDPLSIMYGGQYLPMKGSTDSIDSSISASSVRAGGILGDNVATERIREMLVRNPRVAYWRDIVVAAHVMYALGNSLAYVAKRWWASNGKQRMPYEKENLLNVYYKAFHLLGGCSTGCIVRYNKWTGKFDPVVPCEGFQEISCHRNIGRLFAKLRTDSSVDFLREDDRRTDPWWVGQGWVVRNYVFAVRGHDSELIALVNLNLDDLRAVPSEICFDAMKHLARQLGTFLESETSLGHVHRQIHLWKEVDRVARELPTNTRALCSSVAKALSAKTDTPYSRRVCLVWLVDRVDYSEEQYSNGEKYALTCYSIGHDFPAGENETRRIPDVVPVKLSALREVVDRVILTPREMENVYKDLRDSPAFKDEFVGLNDDSDHLMILPIRAENDDNMERWAGLLIVVESLRNYMTEEDRQLYMNFCHRLFKALQLVTQRGRLEIEREVREHQPDPLDSFGVSERKRRLRSYIQKVTEDIRGIVDVEGVSVFLRSDYPEMDEDREVPIVLCATHNLRGRASGGAACIFDMVRRVDICPDEFDSVVYAPGEGCTGFAMYAAKDSFRIADLNRHKEAFQSDEVSKPTWKERFVEVRNPQIGRRGIICAKLKDRMGRSFGLLRASSRPDGLRFTCFDEDVMSAIAGVLAREISICTYEDKLGFRGQALATVAEAIRVISRLSPYVASYPKCLRQSVLLPVIGSKGFGMGRVAYCEVRGGYSIVAPLALGGQTQQENERIKQLAQTTFEAICPPGMSHHVIESKYDELLQNIISYKLDSFRDNFGVLTDEASLEQSSLGKALKSGAYLIVNPDHCMSKLDSEIARVCQSNFKIKNSFAYIPIKSVFRSKGDPAFLYVDSPFPEDEPITPEIAQSLWTFGSVLGGMWSAVQLSYESTENIRYMSHEVTNLFAGVVAAETSLSDSPNLRLSVEFAYYRASAVLAAFDESRRSRVEIDLNKNVNLYEAMIRLRDFYNIVAEDYGLGKDLIRIPPKDNYWIRGNRSFLDTVLGQLLDNAVKFVCKADGKKEVGFTKPEILNDGRYVKVGIWDTGPGMPDSISEHLFDKPYHGEMGVEGAGLGLLTCKMLLDIWIKKEVPRKIWYERFQEGTGIVFYVVLPLAL